MKILSKNTIGANRPYINLKKLSMKTSLRRGRIDDLGFKTTYIIDMKNNCLSKDKDFTLEVVDGIEKVSFYTDQLNEMILVDVNYSNRSGDKGAKVKAYLVLNFVKYVISYDDFKDVYEDCLDILKKEVTNKTELNCVIAGFNNLEKTEIKVDMDLNLKRLKEFKDRVDYKRNVDYFVINNTLASVSKFDIKDIKKTIELNGNQVVLQYNTKTRLYNLLDTAEKTVTLKETDIICELSSKKGGSTVHIYTEYGLGKLLDIKNNVIPNKNNIALFANILDLGLKVLD